MNGAPPTLASNGNLVDLYLRGRDLRRSDREGRMKIADALRTLWQFATLPRRFEELHRALADESQARARDLAWLRREMRLDRPLVALPNTCWTCGATTGQVVATAERSRWTEARGAYTERVRVVRCATCGACQDAPTEGSEGR